MVSRCWRATGGTYATTCASNFLLQYLLLHAHMYMYQPSKSNCLTGVVRSFSPCGLSVCLPAAPCMMLLRRRSPPPLHCGSIVHRARHIHPAALILAAKAAKITKIATTWGWMAAARGSPERAERFRTLTQRAVGALTLSVGGGGAYIAYQHSEQVAVSGRTRLLLTTREEEIMMADLAAESMLSSINREEVLLTIDLDGVPPPSLGRRAFGLKHRQVDVIKHQVLAAAQRIVRAVRQSSDLPAGCEKLHWRLTVIDKPDTVNAFVLPNGHMFVYTACPALPCLHLRLQPRLPLPPPPPSLAASRGLRIGPPPPPLCAAGRAARRALARLPRLPPRPRVRARGAAPRRRTWWEKCRPPCRTTAPYLPAWGLRGPRPVPRTPERAA